MKKFTAKKRFTAKAVMGNRRGSEMIEAAAVLPLLILLILSLILLIVYYYACISCQVNLHQSLLEEAAESRAIYKKLEAREDVSKPLRGASSIIMGKEISGRIYAMRPAQIIRLGEAAGIDFQE